MFICYAIVRWRGLSVRLCYIQIYLLKPILLLCFSCSEMFNYGMVYMLYDYMFKICQNMIYSNIFFMLLLLEIFLNVIWDFKIFFNQNIFLQYYGYKIFIQGVIYIYYFAMLWLVMFGVLMVHQNVSLYVAWCCQINKHYFKNYYLFFLTSTNFLCIRRLVH